MSYRHIGRARGREVFIHDEPDPEDQAAPRGFSIAAIVLKDGWTSDELGWLLNELYGALSDWTEFDSGGGARSFLFWGERAEEASNLCDTFAYAWTRGVQQQYDDVMAASNDAPDVDGFVEAAFTGEVAIGESYANDLQNTIFAVLVSDPHEKGDIDLIHRVTAAVEERAKQHRFD
ncbi:MAG TPA: hypothetical protein VJP85_04345 [Candidatus Baltobacteraceae bacterium]|nr:hypothetical protein [Candidatus Baltobacteraceae bacterium]